MIFDWDENKEKLNIKNVSRCKIKKEIPVQSCISSFINHIATPTITRVIVKKKKCSWVLYQ